MINGPRIGAVLTALVVLGGLAVEDRMAAGILAIGIVGIMAILARRSRSRTRAVGLSVAGVTTGAAVIAALVIPSYRNAPVPLVVTRPAAAAPGGLAISRLEAAPSSSRFTALGFVASDYNDSAAGVDRDASKLSSLAATGIVLGTEPGTIEVTPARDTLVRAHLNGAEGLAVVSNYDGSDFNGNRAAEVIASPVARRRFLAAMANQVARDGWDGVVLDFERLPPASRDAFPVVVHELRSALGGRPVVVAVPAFTSLADPDAAAYDLAALGRVASRIVWMAYDQHELGDAAGPVAGLPWVKQGLDVVTAAVPADRVLLGVASYGYLWRGRADATEQTDEQAKRLAAAPGSQATWDETQQEWRATTGDGATLWYEDGRGIDVRTQLAVRSGLGGVAVWRVGSDDADALANLPVALKHQVVTSERRVERVTANGVVALTFDDGPDATWTPRILSILRRKHVLATFFVIGTSAQAHPELLRAELGDGDVIANHTYSHEDLSTLPRWRAEAEILGGEAVIEGVTGRKPLMFRSPYGAGDSSSRRLGGDQIANDSGLHAVGWDDDPDDWRRPGARHIVDRVLAGVTERSIVLLHDGGGDRSQTVAALPGIIDGLRSRGYLLTTPDAFDASMASPYAVRHGLASHARSVAIIAGFRLEMALRRVLLWLLVAIAVGSSLRLVWASPLAALHWRRSRGGPRPAITTFPVSVLVPAHNEERVLAKALEALLAVRWRAVEVIVIDDGSTDATAEVARRYPVRLITQAQSGKAAALNAGIAAATGEVVVAIDADTVVDPGFIASVAGHFDDARVGAVAGNVKVGNRRGLLARLQALEYMVSLNLDRRAQAVLNIVAVVPGAAGAFRRQALLDVGGYPGDTLVEDADLTIALLRAGWRIDYEASAIAWTEAPECVRDVLRQRRRWSYGTIEVAAKHAGSVLNPAEGRVGFIGLPWMVLSQVVLPLGGPLADLFLLYLVAVGDRSLAVILLGLAVVLDLVVTGIAVIAEGEDLRLVACAPLLRVVWRPLQLLSVVRSMRLWSQGVPDRWRGVDRYNSVLVPVDLRPTALAGRNRA